MGAIGRISGRVPLGPVAALLLGLAGGFLAWAVPAAVIGAIMRHLHMVAVLPQAAPPYSALTRIALAAAAGLCLAIAVLVGFRRLETGRWLWTRGAEDRSDAPSPQVVQAVVAADDPPAPRLRRADRHPDAPARRPLFAKELLLETPFGEPDALPPADPVPPALSIRRGPALADLIAAPMPVMDVAEDVEAVPRAQSIVEAPVSAPPAEPLVTPAAARPPIAGASVAELMARLEAGLVRHDRALPASPPTADIPLADALRDALADLQRMARR